MNDIVNPQMLVTVGLALVGWLAVHRLSAWRDRVNHRRKMRTDFLLGAFLKLANAAHRAPAEGSPYFRDMETAVSEIQLFGDAKQIEMVMRFTAEFAAQGHASMDELLSSLRTDLRKELGYDSITGNVQWFRPDGSSLQELTASKGGPPSTSLERTRGG